MTLLDKAKNAVRVKSTAFDGEITDLIAAGIVDLQEVGIIVPDTVTASADGDIDARLNMAIMLYCKSNFSHLAADENYKRRYDELKCAMSLSTRYNGYAVD